MAASSRPERGPRMLWVEGKDDQAIVEGLCVKHRVQDFVVVDREGVDRVLNGFDLELRAPDVERFGIVVDGDSDPHARWASIRKTLRAEGFDDVPDALDPDGLILAATEHRPRFGAWVMPDNGSPGAVEEFAAALIPDGDALWARAGEAVDGIPEAERRFPPVRRGKAVMHTWLAWQEHPGSPMGQAIGKGDLLHDAPAAERFVAWLRRLMIEDAAPPA